MLGKIEDRRRRGWQRLKWLDGITDTIDMSLSKLHKLVMDRETWRAAGPRDSQESSPTPQFKSINSSVLSLLHSPTLTSIHDHRKNHSLDRKSTRLNSSHPSISYAVFCLKK